MQKFQLGVIGAGNMAEAILGGVIRGKLLNASEIVASDVSAARLQKLSADLGISVTENNQVPAACPHVLLAVKPQMMAHVLAEAAPHVPADAVVISIAAGVKCETIDRLLGGKGRIIRVMPNTPMLVGAGVSALVRGPRASAEDMAWAKELFARNQAAAVEVAQESMMDAVTAVSGSGPAYFFYLVEAMVDAGIAEGLPREVSLELARQTCLGAGKLLVETLEHPEILRARVTSPNGTTQRAIETKESHGVKGKIIEAVRAAAARSRELGK